MLLPVRVHPRSLAFKLAYKDSLWHVYCTRTPQDNQVNKELVKELSGLLGCTVFIIKGMQSTYKVISIDGEETEVLKRLGEIAGTQ